MGDDVEMSCEATPNRTSKFEVTVNGKLVHSKLKGEGFVDNKAKLDKVIKAVEAALQN